MRHFLGFAFIAALTLALSGCHEPSYPKTGGFKCDPLLAEGDACPPGLICHQDIKQCFPKGDLPPRQFALNLTATGNGTVVVNPGAIACNPPGCAPLFATGTMVTVVATPAADHTTSAWTGDCAATVGESCMVTLDAAKTAAVTFVPLFNVQVSKAGPGGGTVTFTPQGISCGTDCFRYGQGSTVTLTAMAAAPGSFAGWAESCAGRGACPVVVDAAKTVRASFNGGAIPQQVKTLGSTNDDAVAAVTTDALGNIYVAGTFRAMTDFGGGQILSPVGGADIFVARYNSTGTPAWVRTYGGSGDDEASDIAFHTTDAALFITGTFKSPNIVFTGGPTLVNGTSTTTEALIIKVADTGTFRFAERLGSNLNDTAPSVAIAADGNVYVAGSFAGVATYGAATAATSAGTTDSDGYLMKLTSAGVLTWFYRFGNAAAVGDFGHAVAAAGNDAIIVGTFTGSVDFGCGNVSTQGGRDMVVIKIYTPVAAGASATCLWSRGSGSANAARANDPAGIAVNAAGVSFVVSTYDDVIIGTTSPTRGGTDVAVQKFAADGTPGATLQIGGAGMDSAVDVAVDLQNNVMVVGNTTGIIELTAPFGISGRTTDAFAIKLSEALVPGAAHAFGGAGVETARGVCFAPTATTASAFVVGAFGGLGDFGGATSPMAVGGTDGFVLSIAGN